MTLDNLFDIVAEQNRYNNHNGEIPNSSFIHRWHNLTNEQVIDLIQEAVHFMNNSSIKDPNLTAQMKRVGNYVLDNWQFHPNIANPSIKDEKVLLKRYGKSFNKCDNGRTIKSNFFRMVRLITEMFNKELGITIQNSDKDINCYPLDWDGLDPEWESPTQFERLYDK